MKTIEERAMAYAKQFSEQYQVAMLKAYIDSATEQMALDEEFHTTEVMRLGGEYTKEMKKLNEEWKENLEIQRKMLVDKAREWFGQYLMEIGYPDDWLRDSPNMMSGEQRFRKAMEE